jgi:hypothetical protein
MSRGSHTTGTKMLSPHPEKTFYNAVNEMSKGGIFTARRASVHHSAGLVGGGTPPTPSWLAGCIRSLALAGSHSGLYRIAHDLSRLYPSTNREYSSGATYSAYDDESTGADIVLSDNDDDYDCLLLRAVRDPICL